MSDQDSVVIVAGARTPMGGLQGSLSSISAPELGAIAIKAAVERAGIQPADVQDHHGGLHAGTTQLVDGGCASGIGQTRFALIL